MMANDTAQSRDLVLRPGEYSFISDETKGKVEVLVGPHKTSLAATDRPVKFEPATGRFTDSTVDGAVMAFVNAPKGSYVILQNPANDGGQPESGGSRTLPQLRYGHRVNLPGPCYFPLWPGQSGLIVEGHHLRSNQYLLVRVYDEDSAKESFSSIGGINVDTSSDILPEGDDGLKGKKTDLKTDKVEALKVKKMELTTGKLIIVKGTESGFYIPPTGFEVIPDGERFIRNAVTLERLEYCVLLDESGNKRYVRGPEVVFPEPTEQFLTRETTSAKGNPSRTRKFPAIQLNEISGLYIQVIAAYEEGGVSYKEGDELFITGKEQAIYFPRPEHSIISYGDGESQIIYAVAVPEGDARYVMGRLDSSVETVKGPVMLLPDPRKKLIVRRVLDDKRSLLLYPNNQEALAYNRSLRQVKATSNLANDAISDDDFKNALYGQAAVAGSMDHFAGKMLSSAGGESGSPFKKYDARVSNAIEPYDIDAERKGTDGKTRRRASHTPPRTVVIDQKFDGAIKINIWTGYAVQVVNGLGERKVVLGPTVYHFAYDENPEVFQLSTGKPKSTDRLIEDVYLRVLNNRISDVIEAETRDLVTVRVKVSFLLNFEGDPNTWFNVDNYVKFVCDHIRSLTRNKVKSLSIYDFSADYINIMRNVVLGEKVGDEPRGRLFKENNAKIYDVEVLGLDISDDAVEKMLSTSQFESIKQTMDLVNSTRQLEVNKKITALKKEELVLKNELAVADTGNFKLLKKLEEEKLKVSNGVQLAVVHGELKVDEIKKLGIEEISSKILEIRGARDLETEEISRQVHALRGQKEFETAQRSEALEKIAAVIEASGLERAKANAEFEIDRDTKRLDNAIKKIQTVAKAEVDKLAAVQPGLISALESLAQTTLMKDISPGLVPLSIVKNQNIVGILEDMFGGQRFSEIIGKIVNRPVITQTD
jgi:major vault protein